MEKYAISKHDSNYQVSDLGNILSVRTGKLLKQENVNPTKEGLSYKRVTFSTDGVVKRHSVHRLVAECFIPNPLNKPHVNHIDNDPSNNCVTNLEWCTHSENMLHCTKQGRGTSSVAAKQAALNKLSRREEELKSVLGSNFISINTQVRSTVTYLCQKCNKPNTTRIDSTALTQPTILCKKCSYVGRHTK